MFQKLFHSISKHKFLILIILFFGILYASISLVNHYLFRTSAHDLGIYINAMYDYNHFQKNTSTILMPPLFVNSLNDHFELLPIIWAPFYFIFGTHSLLIIQICCILLGGLGVYQLVYSTTTNKKLSLLSIIHFFSIWGIYSALAFDYHNNVIAAMMVPWFIYFFHKEKWIKAFVFLLLVLLSKENMALWAVFICMSLIWLYRTNKHKVIVGIIFSSFSLAYFIVIMKWIMPALGIEGDTYNHFHYQALGKTVPEAIQNIIQHPIECFLLLFNNHTHDKISEGIKSELHLMVLLSGGWALLFRPQYLFMLIPIYAQKLFNDDFVKWGINNHYSIEFVPIISIALFDFISKMHDKSVSRNFVLFKLTSSLQYVKNAALYIAVFSCVLTFGISLLKFDHRTSKWYKAEKHQFYHKKHYTVNFKVQEVYNAIQLIPQNAIVSAQTNLAPHLAYRDTIYLFPAVQNAQFIALLDNGNYYPLGKDKFELEKQKYLQSGEWELIYNRNNTILLKRISPMEQSFEAKAD